MTSQTLLTLLLLIALLAGCATTSAQRAEDDATSGSPTEGRDAAPTDDTSEHALNAPGPEVGQPLADPIPPDDDEPTPGPPPMEETPILPFTSHVASRCLVDQLARTEYSDGWEGWFKTPDFVPDDAPLPQPRSAPMAPLGPEAAQERAAQLQQEWTATPRSHVVDCSFSVAARECPGCAGKGGTTANYIAYLPAALSVDPASVRSILILVPGGNGGRTRYFLTPVPGMDIYRKKSGGLETKRRVNDYAAMTPGATPPIVIALDSAGFLTVNGPTEYLTHDLPLHIARTFLGVTSLDGLHIGIEGISSGARAIMDALRQKPDVFETVGLIGMHCGGRNGITLKDLGTPDERKAWLEILAARPNDRRLQVRFSVGNRDPGWKCNKEFYDMFVEAELLPRVSPTWDCDAGIRPDFVRCSVSWGEEFLIFNGHGHNYGIMLDSWVPQLFWHLQRLSPAMTAMPAP